MCGWCGVLYFTLHYPLVVQLIGLGFMLRCDNEEYFANDEWANDCLSHAGIDQAGIESCMSDSGGLDDDTTNTIDIRP
jgi:hypothetical protein